MNNQELVQGNEACARGALYAGCRFFAGYPITPSSEIMEYLAREMPKVGGVCVQLEDEIASISAVIGASWGGVKAMTATSGPGFSLMQENIGYAAITETPCVIVDCQRWGPSTGQPTKAAQGDVMQARWGTHGDHPVIVLTASWVREVFEMTVLAFNLAEIYRVPVILLLDEVLAHLRENVTLPVAGELQVVERVEKTNGSMPSFGAGARLMVTGMAHDETGFPVQGEKAAQLLKRIVGKIEEHKERLVRYQGFYLDDADFLIVSYGITSRAVEAAVERLRAGGVPIGWLDLKILWPFPDKPIREIASHVKDILVPELNLGQLVREVERAAAGHAPVSHLGRVDGSLITPEEICRYVREKIARVCL
ncbi:MAG: 2-oxoacid:acceptor oxidoreductase subunit alpha [Candidatus Bipolaricaulota bacterium]|nr:2-oxoacid:acceptor oxidoreductase subunit alpha [Candidatus Bipolaricaulota bacterium]MCS7274095.1 2-oxoacid:acceptor oxidoreductase subunit alpha [Candidatus Bipolaricaulota bacterium]MDW8110692.1 2-oxoacid:acceptor oxidoreductase subunit alpha [Candidatus Bipolaricaulota bacterium]MDW8328450.1 2-oxoacid:acceptor oxidoreductase subunit alpha [Candidatus Bipolaricaulota bacterium]